MEIAELKNRLDIMQVASHLGIQVDPKTKRANCPFHNDRTPSLQFSKDKQIATCFSTACDAGTMDVIGLAEKKLGLSTHETLNYLKDFAGQPAAAGIKTEQSSALETPMFSDKDRTYIIEKIFAYFRNGYIMRKDNNGRKYLESRGLDTVKLENLGIVIGYNSAQFHHRGRISKEDMQLCEQAGLLIKSTNGSKTETSYTPWARHCVVFPMKDQSGATVGIYGRSINTNGGHYYLKESKGLFYRPQKSASKIIITESIIDFLTLYQIDELRSSYDFLPIYGTNRFNAEHNEALSQLDNLEEIIFALDGDDAGLEAVKKYSEILSKSLPNVSVSTLELPDGEDVNSLAQGHDQAIFLHLINNRSLLFSPEVESLDTHPKDKDTPSLNTSNKYKLSYTSETATCFVQGGIGRVLDNMKITLVIEASSKKSRNKVDLYEDKQVEKLCKDAAQKLGLEREKLEEDIAALTDLLDTYREQSVTADSKKDEIPQTLTAKERERVEAFLKQKKLIYKLNELLGRSGIAGEDTSRIFLLIIAISYKMAEPLHALIQGSSGSGKTRLLRQISDCMPPEQVIRLTRVSDKGFYNYPENYLANKLMSLEDVDGLGEEATFAFRELQSNGELNSATSIKLENGQIVSGEKRVRGPIASLACTTQGEIYEDNMSRVFLIAVDESMEQTRRIIDYQNRRASGGINEKEEKDTKQFIQQVVRELKPYKVVNPFASKIQLPEEAHKIRRLNDLFQSFVRMTTVLNQRQRRKDKIGRLITELEDIETAIDIMFESIVLKVDELDGSLRQFFERLKAYLQKQYKSEYKDAEFTQREVRQAFNLSKAQCSRYFAQLSELEYIRTKNGNNLRRISYSIDYWDNYSALRKRISDRMKDQVNTLKGNNTEQ